MSYAKIVSITILLLLIVIGVKYYISIPVRYSYFYVEQSKNDQKIVGVKEGRGKKVTVIQSVNKAASIEGSGSLKQIAYIHDPKRIIFLQGTFEQIRDSGPQILWMFDGSTRELKKMALNEYYSGYGALVVSPNQKQAAYVNADDRKNIYLFDLVNDTGRVLKTVAGNFILTNGSVASAGLQLNWADYNTVVYGVYDDTNQIDNDPQLEGFRGGIYSYIGIQKAFIELECLDSDGGDDIYTKGTLKGPELTTGASPVDYCVGALVEYSCSESGGFNQNAWGMYSKSVQCEYGCEEGACKLPQLVAPGAIEPPTTH